MRAMTIYDNNIQYKYSESLATQNKITENCCRHYGSYYARRSPAPTPAEKRRSQGASSRSYRGLSSTLLRRCPAAFFFVQRPRRRCLASSPDNCYCSVWSICPAQSRGLLRCTVVTIFFLSCHCYQVKIICPPKTCKSLRWKPIGSRRRDQ